MNTQLSRLPYHFALFPFVWLSSLGCDRSRDVFLELKTRAKSYGQIHFIIPDNHTLKVIAITAIVSLLVYLCISLFFKIYFKWKLAATRRQYYRLRAVLLEPPYEVPRIPRKIISNDNNNVEDSIDQYDDDSPIHTGKSHRVVDLLEAEQKQKSVSAPESISDPTLMHFLQHDILSEERNTHIRSYNYQTLQAALRNTPKYQKASLILIEKDQQKRVYDLFLNNTLLGSGRWAHIPIRDVTVSPAHARIKQVDARFVIYDLLSANGVYVNHRKILRPKGLINGDDIRIGKMHFRFQGSGTPL